MTRKNILISTVGSAGDILPMLGLGAELKQRGHDVTVLYMPILEEEIRDAGFNFIPLGTMEDIQDAMNDPNIWHPIRAMEVIAKKAILKYMRPLYEEIAKFDPSDTLVIASGMAIGARIAQEKLGVRLLTVHLQSSILMSAYDNAELGGNKLPDWFSPGVRDKLLSLIETITIDRLILPDLNRFRSELGLPPVKHIFRKWMHSPDGVLGLFPAWLSAPQPDWPKNMEQTSFLKFETGFQDLPDEVTAFLDAGDAPIVFTAGSANVHSAPFFKAAVETAQQLGRRAILLSRYKDIIPEGLPDSVLHAEWVPMSRLLQRAALIVHHGGIGTTAQALAAGIPQLITPLAHDQFDNANKLREIGIADRLQPRNFKPERAVPIIQRLLKDPKVKEKTGMYAKFMDFELAAKQSGDYVESFLSD